MKMRPFKREIREKKGIALIMALWIMTILLVVAASFAFMMRTEVKMAGNYRNGVKAHYLALAGVEHAIAVLLNDTGNTDHYDDAWHTTFRTNWNETAVTWDALPISYGGGTYAVHLSDENSKLSLNYANAVGTMHLVDTDALGTVNFQEKVCNIFDYRDGAQTIPPFVARWDNSTEMDYMTKTGYEGAGCKDNFFDTVYEIQKVTGINLGAGGVYDNPLDENSGRGSQLDMTVYSQDQNTQVDGTVRSVDVKTCSQNDFTTVGFTTEEAYTIYDTRENQTTGFVDYGYPLYDSPAGSEPPTTMGVGTPGWARRDGGTASDGLDCDDHVSEANMISAADKMTCGSYDSGIIKGTVNINTATVYGLRGLFNINVTKADAIIAHRLPSANGPFPNRGKEMDVTGISKGIFQDHADLVTVRSDRFRIYSTGKVGIDGNSDGDLEDSEDTLFAARKIEAVVDRHYYDTPFQTPGPIEVLYWSERVFED